MKPTNTLSTPKTLALLPSIQDIVNRRGAVSRIPKYMTPMGGQHLVEFGWNTKHGCYSEDHRGYTDLDDTEKAGYEYQKKTMKDLKTMALGVTRGMAKNSQTQTDEQIQEMCKILMKMVAGETGFGLIFSYVNDLDFFGIEAIFLKVVKRIPDVVYKIMPVLIHETHECTCEDDNSDAEDDFENDCGCSSEVYSVTPEDINYTLNTKSKDRYVGHPLPFGGGGTRFYVIRGQGFGHSWNSKEHVDNVTEVQTYLQRAIVVTSFSATAHKKRKYAEGKPEEEK